MTFEIKFNSNASFITTDLTIIIGTNGIKSSLVKAASINPIFGTNMTEDFSLKALVLGRIRLSASAEGQKLLKP